MLEFSEAVGSGSYGAVYAVNFNGRACIGKRLYEILKRDIHQNQSHCYNNFVRECVLMSQTNHPNIVKFIGIHFGRDHFDLTLLMERLHSDLGVYLEGTPNLHFLTKLSILHDTSCGLVYLHENCSIIHRDLSAANILLTKENRAKIADLGMSKIFSVDGQKMTVIPGTQAYMSPEVLQEKPYDNSLDIFPLELLFCMLLYRNFLDSHLIMFLI